MKIDTLEGVQLGGITQWIRVRGADASNPVLLLMQQGPGLPIINDARRLEHLLGLQLFGVRLVHRPPQQLVALTAGDEAGFGEAGGGAHRTKGSAGV